MYQNQKSGVLDRFKAYSANLERPNVDAVVVDYLLSIFSLDYSLPPGSRSLLN